MRVLVLTTMILAMTCGCQDSHREGAGTLNQSIPRITDETEQPYLQLNEQQLVSFVAKVQKIKNGDNLQQVEALLGVPWSDELQYEKSPSHAFVGRFLKYYVRKKDKELVNVRFDHWVEFRFDQNNRLTAIYAQNIEGIKNQP